MVSDSIINMIMCGYIDMIYTESIGMDENTVGLPKKTSGHVELDDCFLYFCGNNRRRISKNAPIKRIILED